MLISDDIDQLRANMERLRPLAAFSVKLKQYFLLENETMRNVQLRLFN